MSREQQQQQQQQCHGTDRDRMGIDGEHLGVVTNSYALVQFVLTPEKNIQENHAKV